MVPYSSSNRIVPFRSFSPIFSFCCVDSVTHFHLLKLALINRQRYRRNRSASKVREPQHLPTACSNINRIGHDLDFSKLNVETFKEAFTGRLGERNPLDEKNSEERTFCKFKSFLKKRQRSLSTSSKCTSRVFDQTNLPIKLTVLSDWAKIVCSFLIGHFYALNKII